MTRNREEVKNNMSNFEIIDLSEVVVARRGAEASYDEALLDAMAGLKAGEALAAVPLAVERSNYKTDNAFKNVKQTVGASIRKHFDYLVLCDRIAAGSKVRVNWHPETGIPQISLR
jgi:hypothetical protein